MAAPTLLLRNALSGVLLGLAAGTVMSACSEVEESNRDALPSYVDQSTSNATELLVPGINTGMNERDATMSPDGSELYFTVWSGTFGTIMMAQSDGDGWTSPRVAPFSGVYNDLEPSISPDGRRLFFASSRPTGRDSTSGDYNIWVVQRAGDTWSQPEPVDEISVAGANEYYPSVTAGGDIYFTAKRDDGSGGEDIWRASPEGEGYGKPELVPGGVNSERDEFNAFVAPDASYIIFSSWGREDGLGGGDLYVSFLEPSREFGDAINMGPAINSPSLDYSPYVSPDGSTLFFSSRRSFVESPADGWTYARLHEALRSPGNGLGDILRVEATVLDSLRAVHAD